MKILEILDTENTSFRLTITPEKISIKMQKDSTEEERNAVLKFFKFVYNQDTMKNCIQSFRGTFKIKDNNWKIQMQTNRKTEYFTFDMATTI